MEIEYKGVFYPVSPTEPSQQRGLELCHPIFADLLTAYVTFAQRYMPHELRIGETRRSKERQLYLYAKGRLLPGKIVSRTLDSRHRWGLACDLYALDRETGEAVWDSAVWEAMLNNAPPAWFGLDDIRPFELVHLELASADALIARADELGLYQS